MQTQTRGIRNFVGREQVDPAEGRYCDLVNPSTGEAYTIGSELTRTKG